jgi:hypothetical protein
MQTEKQRRALWEAQARRDEFVPHTGSTAAALQLVGLVTCSCGEKHRAKAGPIGAGRQRRPSYVMTRGSCVRTFGISAQVVDEYVRDVLRHALLTGEPHVAAIIEGDDRYTTADVCATPIRANTRRSKLGGFTGCSNKTCRWREAELGPRHRQLVHRKRCGSTSACVCLYTSA